MSKHADPPAARASPSCPVCGKPAGAGRLQPFCTVRCADIDLGRWLTGQYRIPGPPPEDEPLDEALPPGPAGGSA